MAEDLGQQLIRQNLSFFFAKVREETNVCQTEGVMRGTLSARKIYSYGESTGKFPLILGDFNYVLYKPCIHRISTRLGGGGALKNSIVGW